MKHKNTGYGLRGEREIALQLVIRFTNESSSKMVSLKIIVSEGTQTLTKMES